MKGPRAQLAEGGAGWLRTGLQSGLAATWRGASGQTEVKSECP